MGHRQIRMASELHSLHSGMWGSLTDVMERYQQILAKIKSSRRNKEVNSAPSATLTRTAWDRGVMPDRESAIEWILHAFFIEWNYLNKLEVLNQVLLKSLPPGMEKEAQVLALRFTPEVVVRLSIWEDGKCPQWLSDLANWLQILDWSIRSHHLEQRAESREATSLRHSFLFSLWNQYQARYEEEGGSLDWTHKVVPRSPLCEREVLRNDGAVGFGHCTLGC